MADNFYGITDTGKMRDNNEDNYIAQTIANGKYIAGCVIDGVGGYEGGEVAASVARNTILQTLKKPAGNIIDTCKTAFIKSNQKIYVEKHKSDERQQMACVVTLAIADINENKFYYAHVGDTRLYLFRDHSLVKVTRDHSFVGFLEESGRLTEEAAMQHPKRNEINKALGFDEEKFTEPDYIDTGESPFLPGDILLLCSDGLSDMLDSRSISGILSSRVSLKEKGKSLINAANAAGGKDNITVVLVQNNKKPLRQEATKPVVVKKNDPPQAATIENRPDVETIVYNERSSGVGVRFLAVLCFLLLVTLAWFVYNDYFAEKNKYAGIRAGTLPASAKREQQLLSDSIHNTSSNDLLLAGVFKQTRSLTINSAVAVNKDSLRIHGDGLSLVADSGYHGAAIIIAPTCKYVLLDNITFEDFDIGLLTHNKALHLKNVQFKNCLVQVAFAGKVSNSYPVSGYFTDSLIFKIDTLKTDTSK